MAVPGVGAQGIAVVFVGQNDDRVAHYPGRGRDLLQHLRQQMQPGGSSRHGTTSNKGGHCEKKITYVYLCRIEGSWS